jgi:hypothetical protein
MPDIKTHGQKQKDHSIRTRIKTDWKLVTTPQDRIYDNSKNVNYYTISVVLHNLLYFHY